MAKKIKISFGGSPEKKNSVRENPHQAPPRWLMVDPLITGLDPGVNFDPGGTKRVIIKACDGVKNDPKTHVGVKIDPRTYLRGRS